LVAKRERARAFFQNRFTDLTFFLLFFLKTFPLLPTVSRHLYLLTRNSPTETIERSPLLATLIFPFRTLGILGVRISLCPSNYSGSLSCFNRFLCFPSFRCVSYPYLLSGNSKCLVFLFISFPAAGEAFPPFFPPAITSSSPTPKQSSPQFFLVTLFSTGRPGLLSYLPALVNRLYSGESILFPTSGLLQSSNHPPITNAYGPLPSPLQSSIPVSSKTRTVMFSRVAPFFPYYYYVAVSLFLRTSPLFFFQNPFSSQQSTPSRIFMYPGIS